MQETYTYIDEHLAEFVDELLPFIAQPSVSGQNLGMDECAEMLVGLMTKVGIETEVIQSAGAPFVYGQINVGPDKPQLLIYGHYDVVSADPVDQWSSPPFQPEIRDNRIYARGAGDNKGQLFAHLKAVEAYRKTKGELPVNVTFLFDGEEEIGSPHVADLIKARPDIFEADALLVADASTLEQWDPIVFYGVRGLLYLELRTTGSPLEWHAGSYGNLVPNPALQLAQALATMRDRDGTILIEGFYDGACAVEKIDREVMERIPFDPKRKLEELGVAEFWGRADVPYYEKMFYQPSFTIAGLISGYTGQGPKSVVPNEAVAKIDICLVPGQEPEVIYERVRDHLNRHGFGDIQIEVLVSCKPTKEDFHLPFGKVVAESIRQVWGKDPIIYPSIGGGGPFYLFSQELGLPTLMVPYAQPDLHEHAPDESLHIDWFGYGIKTTATIIEKFASYPSKASLQTEGNHVG